MTGRGQAGGRSGGAGRPGTAVALSESVEVLPVESLDLPRRLDGSDGSNRNPDGAGLRAGNDLEAMKAWLAARAANPNTFSAYRKEAERFLLWCVIEKRTALSSLPAEEAADYLRWLEDLGRLSVRQWSVRWRMPQAVWIGPRNAERGSAGWKPFNGPLSVASRRQAIIVVRNFFSFLVKTGYLRFNPFDQISPKIPLLPGEGAPKQFADRSLTAAQWEDVLEALESRPEGLAKSRLEVILMMGKGLGMRASEMLEARAGWVVKRRIGRSEATMIEVVGKGDKVRRLPLQPVQVRIINAYLRARGLGALGQCAQDTPILARQGKGRKPERPGEALSRSGLHKILKEFLEFAAAAAEEKDPLDGAKLRAASTHWLRHTFASAALESMPVNIVQTALGHASISTTSLYLVPTERALAEAMKKMKPL